MPVTEHKPGGSFSGNLRFFYFCWRKWWQCRQHHRAQEQMSTPAIINGQDLSDRSHLGSAPERPGSPPPSPPRLLCSWQILLPFALSSQPEPKKSLWFNINNEDDVDNNNRSHLLRAPSARHFPWIIYTCYNNSVRQALLCSFFSQGDGGSERLSGLPKFTQQIKSRVWIQTWICLLWSLCHLHFVFTTELSSWFLVSALDSLPKPSIWLFDAFAHSAPAVSSSLPPLPSPPPPFSSPFCWIIVIYNMC